MAYRHLSVYGELTWAANSIFKKGFKSIGFNMYNVYLNIGFRIRFLKASGRVRIRREKRTIRFFPAFLSENRRQRAGNSGKIPHGSKLFAENGVLFVSLQFIRNMNDLLTHIAACVRGRIRRDGHDRRPRDDRQPASQPPGRYPFRRDPRNEPKTDTTTSNRYTARECAPSSSTAPSTSDATRKPDSSAATIR